MHSASRRFRRLDLDPRHLACAQLGAALAAIVDDDLKVVVVGPAGAATRIARAYTSRKTSSTAISNDSSTRECAVSPDCHTPRSVYSPRSRTSTSMVLVR